MNWKITPLQPLAARVEGIDLGQPLQPHEVRQIEALMDSHAVLVFPGQRLASTSRSPSSGSSARSTWGCGG